MRLFDKKFRGNITGYVLQCCLATLAILVILIFLNIIKYPAIVASLGASCFIAFTMPHTRASKPRALIGGYMVGVIAGTICHFISEASLTVQILHDYKMTHIALAALSVGLAMFIMVITDTEHAPAAGLALGLVLNEWDLYSVAFIVFGIITLSVTKELIKPALKNLV
ncbi:MAG: HPP family protein [Candidatus Omnitrophota bacterium]